MVNNGLLFFPKHTELMAKLTNCFTFQLHSAAPTHHNFKTLLRDWLALPGDKRCVETFRHNTTV